MNASDFLHRVQLYLVAAQMAAGTISGLAKKLAIDLAADPADDTTANGMMLQLTHHYAERLAANFADSRSLIVMPKIDRAPTPVEGLAGEALRGPHHRAGNQFSDADIEYLREALGITTPRLAPTNPPPGKRGRTPLPVTEDQGEEGADIV